MRTLIVSDLHLGSAARADVLRMPELRDLLLDAVRDADRLVLLGDLLELRDSARPDAMSAARPFFEDLGRVLAGREVLVVAGNHDHALVAPWLAWRREFGETDALGLEQRLTPDASPVLAALARWMEPARLGVSYPGLWIRDDVYATHGHYLDCHMGITSGERLMLAVRSHLPGGQRRPRSVDEYEAVAGSVYARLDASAALRRLAYSRWVARLGRLLAGLSNEELVRAETAAMGEVAATLGLGDVHVVFGHTHRPGPFAGDDRSVSRGRLGARLVNCGCWLEHGMRANAGAHAKATAAWQAPCVIVENSGPPVAVWLDGRLSTAMQGSERLK
ncbi:MAG: metallophosphoesterase [Solirubrobacteraceae bacterium]